LPFVSLIENINHEERFINQNTTFLYGESIMPQGEKNKLTESDKEEIFAYKGVKSAYKLADEFGVSHTAIYNVWKPKKKSKMVSKKIDTDILRRMIPVFVDNGIKVNNLSTEMVDRIKELYQEEETA